MKRIATLLALGCFFLAAPAMATLMCWDNTDTTIAKLRKVELNTTQLADIFKYQKDHRDLVARAHTERLGCQIHEANEAEFEKKAVGVLDDGQFQKFAGRKRTEIETLRYENYLLKKEIEQLKKALEELKKG